MKTSENKLQSRDFISIGVFTLIYAAVTFVVGGVSQMTRVTFALMPAAVALFTGPIFMLYTAKTPKRGALTIMGVIIGILSFASGMFWMMAVFYAVFGVLADLICASGKFKSFKRNLLGYCVFALPPMGGHVPMAILPEQFDAFMAEKGDFSAFSGVIDAIGANWWALPLMAAITVLCAVISGMSGRKLLRKHFERAGIV